MPSPVPIPSARKHARPSRSPNRRSPIPPSPIHAMPSRSPNTVVHTIPSRSPNTSIYAMPSRSPNNSAYVVPSRSPNTSVHSMPSRSPNASIHAMPPRSPSRHSPIHITAPIPHGHSHVRRPSNSHARLVISEQGAAQHQGDRPYQEDAYVVAPPGRYAPNLPNTQAIYAVYDGHGGSVASSHAARNLHTILLAEPSFHEGRYEQALFDAFRAEDRALQKHMRKTHTRTGGSTAVVCVLDLTLGTVAVANVGDSRAVLARREEAHGGRGPFLRAVRLSQDQNPTNPDERQRIESHGGYVTADGRVGTLNVSRSLGDFAYKATTENIQAPSADLRAATRPGAAVTGDLVSPRPHVANCALHATHTPFLVLASDGLFARWSDQQLVDTVSHLHYTERLGADDVARRLVAAGADGAGTDNCTCIILFFG